MSKYPTIKEKYTVLRCFARLCEHMYRKGVRDGAELYSPEMVDAFLFENDPTTGFRFAFDEDGRPLKLDFYCAIASMYLIKIGAGKGSVLLDPSQIRFGVRSGAAALVFSYYRKGLKDGNGIDHNDAIDYYLSDEKFLNHTKMDGTQLSPLEFIEDMRMEALRLDSSNFKNGTVIWMFICQGLNEFYARGQYR